MRVCPLCSRRFDDGARFCPYDGTPVRALDPFVGTILDGKYRIDALLGTGAMGAVYGATQLNLNRAVACLRLSSLRGAIVRTTLLPRLTPWAEALSPLRG